MNCNLTECFRGKSNIWVSAGIAFWKEDFLSLRAFLVEQFFGAVSNLGRYFFCVQRVEETTILEVKTFERETV